MFNPQGTLKNDHIQKWIINLKLLYLFHLCNILLNVHAMVH